MCIDPATLAAIGAKVGASFASMSTMLTVAATGISAISTINAANSQAEIAAANADAQTKAASDTLQQGNEESDRRRAAAAQQEGANRAAMAANGVDVTGSQSLGILDDQATIAEADAFAIRETSRRRAGGNAQQAANYLAEASSVKAAAVGKVFGTILTGAAKVGSKYSRQVGTQVAGGAY